MAISFIEEKKRQKKLVYVFGFLIVATIIILIQGLIRKILPGKIETIPVTQVFRKADIDFTFLENQSLKGLEPFEGIEPFEEKTGRDNPFIPY